MNPDRRRAAGAVRATAAAALLLALPLAGPDARAAGWPEEMYNPQPQQGDILLPMPCDGQMAFRKVSIPSSGPLADRKVQIGSSDGERGWQEGNRPAYIAGSFSEAGGNERYFLLGKYEVTQLQWAALSEACPKLSAESRLPKADVGWTEAVQFADQYSRWLRQNAAGKLPKEEGEIGFVRLPTEEEWEFAARGGIAVSESEFIEPIFPMPDGVGRYVWFAGASSSNGKVQRIGLLKPNPLGLHDILGNLDEMVLDPFRLNRLDRLHGQAGGFIVRGGSVATAEQDVRSSYRHEVPYYQGSTPRRARTTGFRLAVAVPVLTSRDRLKQIEEEWGKLGAQPSPAATTDTPKPPPPPGLSDKPLDNPIDELSAIAAAASDPNMKKRLQNLQVAFRASFDARDQLQGRAAKSLLRLGTFLCQKLKDDAVPLDRMKAARESCVKDRGADNERCVAMKKTIDEEEGKQWQNLLYYADTIVFIVRDYDDKVLDEQLSVLRSELVAGGHQSLTRVAERYYDDVRAYRKQQVVDRSKWLGGCKGV